MHREERHASTTRRRGASPRATSPLEKFEYNAAGDLSRWRTKDAELVFEDHDLEHRPRRTRQKRYAGHSGFTTATVRDEFVQTHEWNSLGERKAWTVPAAPSATAPTRVEETYDAEGNVATIARGGALLMSADYRAAGRPLSRTVHTGSASIVCASACSPPPGAASRRRERRHVTAAAAAAARSPRG